MTSLRIRLPWNKRQREPATVAFFPWEVGVAGPEADPAHSEAKCRASYGALALTCILVTSALALSGCVFVVESDSHYRYGRLHGSASLDAIQPGVTTRTWVVENLGQPSSTYLNEAGNEVLSYVTVREQDTEVAFLFLFNIDVSEEEVKTLHIEIEEDWVKSFWLERP